MRDIRVATAQFEHRDNDKAYSLSRIEALAQRATVEGAEVVCFHECCIPGYSWIQPLPKSELLSVAERVPDGQSTCHLIQLAKHLDVVLMAGLLERDENDQVYNTYIAVDGGGLLARFRKLHAFVNASLASGQEFKVVEIRGCQIGFLICYDNNLPENVRITAMMGAEIIVMPHVTGCLPSIMPGRGTVDRDLWECRHEDPVRLRQEFRGPKGREWLMRWLPARAYENGIYAVFSNPIGWDYDTVKPGLSMILDPFGEVLVECHSLDDEVVVGQLTAEKISVSSGQRYLKARRPELYDRLIEPQESVTLPGWQMKR